MVIIVTGVETDWRADNEISSHFSLSYRLRWQAISRHKPISSVASVATAATSLEDPPVSACRTPAGRWASSCFPCWSLGHIPHHPQEPKQMKPEISCSWFLSGRYQAGIHPVWTQTFKEGITPSPASKHLQCFIAEAQCQCHKMGRSMADRVRSVSPAKWLIQSPTWSSGYCPPKPW